MNRLHYNYRSSFASIFIQNGEIYHNIYLKRSIDESITIISAISSNHSPVPEHILKEEIRRYIRFMYQMKSWKIHSQQDPCAICLKNFTTSGTSLKCRHIFHRTCIIEWFSVCEKCPICRTPIII